MQALLDVIYPPHCLVCSAVVDSQNGLCARCWRDTPFIAGLVCDACGTPLPGTADPGETIHCDACMALARPWTRGRAALLYRDNGRRLVLTLKHAGKSELAEAAAGWLARAAAPILRDDLLVAPVPLHWRRLLSRRYNQSALLSAALARRLELEHCPDLLRRIRATPQQFGRGVDARFSNLEEAIRPHPGRSARLQGRRILLIDDVMTSGATMAAGAEACLCAGAREVRMLTLARAARED